MKEVSKSKFLFLKSKLNVSRLKNETIEISDEEYEILKTFNDNKDFYEGANNKTPFKINNVENNNKVIILPAGSTYELEGYHEGQIIIDAISVKPTEWTTIKLNNVTIVSDEAYGILYNCPESENKGYQGLYVTLEKDSQNFVVCNKVGALEEGETYASIDSWKDLTVQGVGYLAVYNNIGHGLRGETLTIAGPHVYSDTVHDGVHGKDVNILDGEFYFQAAKDAVGTTDKGKINVFGGNFTFVNVTEDHFDSKKDGYYAITGVSGTNMHSIEEMYEEGVVIAYPTKSDYENGTNATVLNPVITNILATTCYNADAEGNIVASSTPAGYTTWEVDEPEESLFAASLAYIVTEQYKVIEVSGNITYPIVRPFDAITITSPTFSKKGKLNGGYEHQLDIYLNGAVVVTDGHAPSIANLPDVGRVKITAVKDTINAIINKDTVENDPEGLYDHDAIKSENNISIELKNGSVLYVTSGIGDGIDGGETRFTDSKGAFIATKCGQRGVKGNAIVIGPDAIINASVIESYITDPLNPDYSSFDGIFIAKGNVVNHTVGQGVATVEDPNAKLTGFADVYGRNGKHSKGMFGTTNEELKGIAIIGSLGAAIKLDTGGAQNLYVNNVLADALNPVTPVVEAYKVVPYDSEPIV